MPADLALVPDFRERTIVVGTSVRKPLPVLQAHLASLLWQELPPQTKLHFVYVPDFAPDQVDALAFLQQWITAQRGELIRGAPGGIGDFADGPGLASHQWSETAMARVGSNKNKILKRAVALKADAVFLCDADLILDRTTLASLIACDRPIACGVYWTHWQRSTGNERVNLHAGPQVWLNHPYEMSGRGMEDWEFRGKLVRREVTQVWGQGACTLLDRRVIEAGIDFSRLPDLPTHGLWAGEDRHFCVRAERSHIAMYADPWPDIFHVYHRPEDEAEIPAMALRLGATHAQSAQLGDLVSIKVHPLEPVPTARGYQALGPMSIRGRLGQIPLLGELEESVYDLTRGQTTTVRANIPLSHPLGYLRGRARLFRVTLVDCKKNIPSPILERELFVGPKSKATHDTALLSDPQIAGLQEERPAG